MAGDHSAQLLSKGRSAKSMGSDNSTSCISTASWSGVIVMPASWLCLCWLWGHAVVAKKHIDGDIHHFLPPGGSEHGFAQDDLRPERKSFQRRQQQMRDIMHVGLLQAAIFLRRAYPVAETAFFFIHARHHRLRPFRRMD